MATKNQVLQAIQAIDLDIIMEHEQYDGKYQTDFLLPDDSSKVFSASGCKILCTDTYYSDGNKSAYWDYVIGYVADDLLQTHVVDDFKSRCRAFAKSIKIYE